MTTIVTLKTHDWPVQVDTRQEHSHRSPERRGYGSRHDSEFVPAHSERSFTISQGAHVSFTELPKDATALPSYGVDDDDYSLDERRRAGALQFAVTVTREGEHSNIILAYARAFEHWLRDGDPKETDQ